MDHPMGQERSGLAPMVEVGYLVAPSTENQVLAGWYLHLQEINERYI